MLGWDVGFDGHVAALVYAEMVRRVVIRATAQSVGEKATLKRETSKVIVAFAKQ